MTRRYYSNTAKQVTISSPIATSDTSFTINEDFTGWPSSVPFDAVLEYGTINAEIVTVTNIASKTATCTRGQDGTTAVSHSAAATVDHVVIAKDLDEANAHVNAVANVHGAVGALVDTGSAQTLSGKTLTSPTLTSPSMSGTASAGSTGLTVTGSGTTTLTVGSSSASGTPLKVTAGSTGTTPALRIRNSTDSADLFTVDGQGKVIGNSDANINGILTVVGNVVAPRFSGKLNQVYYSVGSLPTSGNSVNDLAYVAGSGWFYWNGSAWTGQSSDTGWLSCSITSGWANDGGVYGPTQARQIGSVVYIRGGVTNTNFNSTVWTAAASLPAGIGLPTNTPLFALPNPQSATIARNARVTTAGNIEITSAGGANSFTYALDVIRYLVG